MHTLGDDNFYPGRFNAQRAELLQAARARTAGCQQQGVAVVGTQGAARTVIEKPETAVGRAGFFVTAVRQSGDGCADRERRAVLLVAFAADTGFDARADSGGLALAHHLGVTHRLEQIADTQAPRRMQDMRRVARAAAAHVVAHVEQHHRARNGGLRALQCPVDRHATLIERGTHVPGRQRQLPHHVVGQRLVVVGQRDKRHAHLGHIGVGVTFDHADRQNSGPPALLFGQQQQVRQRFVLGTLAQDIRHQR